MEATDEQLMLAYRAGDAGAFETLYSRHKGALYRFILRSVREPAVAEELFQEVWMRVIEARARYEPQARFRTWLFTIAQHRMVDRFRRRGLKLVPLDAGDDPPLDPPARAADQPERQAETREQMARLASALDALPQAQREVFLLREEAGMSLAEIAQATGTNEEAAKSRLRYALAKLREAISGHG